MRQDTIDRAAGDEVDELVAALILARHRDPAFDVDAIARALRFSRRQLYRRAGGDGIAAQIARQRLSSAMQLITEEPALSLSEVAARSGFPGLATMRSLFHAHVGMTPSAYRQRAHVARAGR